jgi:hypothetical protein
LQIGFENGCFKCHGLELSTGRERDSLADSRTDAQRRVKFAQHKEY